MLSFSQDAYRQYFYRHWDWMTETVSSKKSSFPPLIELAKIYDRCDERLQRTIGNLCFMCGAAGKSMSSCGKCPNHEWRNIPWHCSGSGTAYQKWLSARQRSDIIKYASQIAQLPWRGKSREEWEKEDGIR